MEPAENKVTLEVLTWKAFSMASEGKRGDSLDANCPLSCHYAPLRQAPTGAEGSVTHLLLAPSILKSSA